MLLPSIEITIEAALADIANGSDQARKRAAMALGGSDSKLDDVTMALRGALSDNVTDVPRHAIRSLYELATRGHRTNNVKSAFEEALNSKDNEVLEVAVSSLRFFPTPQSFEQAANFTRHDSAAVRYAAVVTLGALDATGARDHLRKMLKDKDSEVVGAAALALADASDADTAKALKQALSTVTSVHASIDVAYALACLGDSAGKELLLSKAADPEFAWDALPALDKIDDDDIEKALAAHLPNALAAKPHHIAIARTLLLRNQSAEVAIGLLSKTAKKCRRGVAAIVIDVCGEVGALPWGESILSSLESGKHGSFFQEEITEARQKLRGRHVD